MKKFSFVILTVIISLIVSCSNKQSKKQHKRTTKLIEQLYVETYTVFGSGAFGTDMVRQFLTDSTLFREYIGTFDEGSEYFHYKVLGDTVYIYKYKSSVGKTPKELLEKKVLIISDLKKTNTLK